MSELQLIESSHNLRAPIDIFSSVKKKDIASADVMTPSDLGVPKQDTKDDLNTLDFHEWLPFASKELCISSDIMDYIIVPVIIMPSDLPNRNGVGFPLSELVKFNTEFGMQAYKTFKGKPTYYEHKNQDCTKAKGVIIDTYMRKFKGFGGGSIWKLVALLGFDRTKDPELCNRIVTGDINTYSMGSYVTKYTCSVCGRDKGKCTHLSNTAKVNFNLIDGKYLAYCLAMGICGFETSAVENPAYPVAISDYPMPIDDHKPMLVSSPAARFGGKHTNFRG